MDEEMNLFCVIDVNCPPVELKRTKNSFSYSFDVKEPLPGFMLLFSQGKWLDSEEDLCLKASLFVNNKCQEFGFLSKNNKSIAKEVNFNSRSKKISRARLEVKPINACSSKKSDEKYKETKDDSVPKEDKEEIGTESADKTKISNSSKKKKSAPCDKQKIALPEKHQEKMSLRKDRKLKEVENLRDPKELETSCNENGITKGVKKAGRKTSKKVTPEESQIRDLHMKEIKENVPKTKSNNVVSKTRSLRSRNSSSSLKKNDKNQQDNEKKKVTEEPKSKDEDLLKSDDPKIALKIRTGKRNKSTTEKECKEEELIKKNKSSEILDNKANSLKKSKVKKQTQSMAKSCTQDLKQGSIDICKSDNIVEENGKENKDLPSSVVEEVKSQKNLAEKKPIQIKKDNLQKKTSSISKVVNLTLVKNVAKGKKSLKKKGSAKSKISKDIVKTKQTTLQFNTFASKTKENSILKESGTPSKKRKLSVSFGDQSIKNKPEEPQLPSDVKESKINLDCSPKRRKTKTDIDSEMPLKDTEALMEMTRSDKDIEYKSDQKENTTESLKTPHVNKNLLQDPITTSENKSKRVSFESTPDSGSTPKKRSPKRVRTLKNEFAKSPLLKESNAKYPAMCKDVTDRSCHPSERWGPTLSMVGLHKAILIGGQGEKQVFNKDSVWSLNPETRKWKQLETLSEGPRPDLRMGHTATYDPTVRCIYVYGGSKNLKWYNDVHALDVHERLWQLVEVTGKAPTRAYHTSCLYRHEIWVFGGVYPKPDPQPDGCSNEIHVFSPIMGNWYMPIVNGEKPAARSGHSATIINEKMVIFGGWDFPYCFNDIYILDLNLVEWRKPEVKGSLPKPRSWHASCALSHNRVLIHGGYDGDFALDDVHIFDVATMCWMEILLTSSPVPRAGHSCLCLPFTSANEEDDEILIFGGGDNEKKFFGDLFSISVPFRPAIKN